LPVSRFKGTSAPNTVCSCMNFISFIHQWLYSFLLDPGLSFSFVIFFYAEGRTHWTGDQPVTRPLPTHRTTQTHNKCTHRHPCLEWDSNPRFQSSRSKNSSYLRPRGHCDRLCELQLTHRYTHKHYMCFGVCVCARARARARACVRRTPAKSVSKIWHQTCKMFRQWWKIRKFESSKLYYTYRDLSLISWKNPCK
jgi:hypothetical protein